jgi:hypothetical protein
MITNIYRFKFLKRNVGGRFSTDSAEEFFIESDGMSVKEAYDKIKDRVGREFVDKNGKITHFYTLEEHEECHHRGLAMRKLRGFENLLEQSDAVIESMT